MLSKGQIEVQARNENLSEVRIRVVALRSAFTEEVYYRLDIEGYETRGTRSYFFELNLDAISMLDALSKSLEQAKGEENATSTHT